jgi:hypothetical protein
VITVSEIVAMLAEFPDASIDRQHATVEVETPVEAFSESRAGQKQSNPPSSADVPQLTCSFGAVAVTLTRDPTDASGPESWCWRVEAGRKLVMFGSADTVGGLRDAVVAASQLAAVREGA